MIEIVFILHLVLKYVYLSFAILLEIQMKNLFNDLFHMKGSYHLGTKLFQILFKHLSSSPSTLPLAFLSHPASFKPKIVKSYFADALSISFKVLLSSFDSLRSASIEALTAGLVILEMF